MPQLQSIVLTDRATTPVNHTFVPQGIDAKTGVASVVESTGVPIGLPRMTISMRPGDRYRGRLTLVVPVVQSVTDASGVTKPIVVRSASFFGDFVFSDESTEAERANLVGMVASALASAKVLVNDTLVKLEGVY